MTRRLTPEEEHRDRFDKALAALAGVQLDKRARRFVWNVAQFTDPQWVAGFETLIEQVRRGAYPEINDDQAQRVRDVHAWAKQAPYAPGDEDKAASADAAKAD